MANTYSTKLVRASAQYWSRADAGEVGIEPTGNFTIEAWIKLASNGIEQNVVANTAGDGYQGILMRVTAGNVLRCFTLGNSPDLGSVDSTTTFSTATWYHLACVYNGSNIQAYVNGTSEATTNTTVNPTANTLEFRIGSRSTDTTNTLDGQIDDVRVWNVARTAAQISDNRSVELVGNETGLQGYWKFNNDGLDTTSNANDLTNNGSATFVTDVPFTGTTSVNRNMGLMGVGN